MQGLTVSDQVQVIRQHIAEHPEKATVELLGELDELDRLIARNPLQKFWPHPAQFPAFCAMTPVVAVFAGNRFGKTTFLVNRILIECVDTAALPVPLRRFKRWDENTAPNGTACRIVNPSNQLLEGVIIPAFREWCPPDQLLGGSFDKALRGAPDRRLAFKNGSSISFMTYEQDLSKFGGWKGHVVGYDEPPPLEIREECMARLVDFGGYELFAMTPLKANTGWIRREIFKKRESPDITVIRGSIHDNPNLNQEAKDRFLNTLSSDLWRQAREFGDFVDIGGLIYADFERIIAKKPFPGDFVRSLDVVVGIDPGIRNTGIVFGGFDGDNTLHVFDAMLLQDKTPDDYVKAISKTLSRWGIDPGTVTHVIDPAARQRAQVNAETVQSALMRLGVFTVNGQNDVEAGIQQVRLRIQHKRLWISPEPTKGLLHLREEADEYAAEDRPDGEFKPIKANDHILDSLRYLAMYRPFDPQLEEDAAGPALGWRPNVAPDAEWWLNQGSGPVGPMGSLA